MTTIILILVLIICCAITYTIGVSQGASKYLKALYNTRHSALEVQLKQTRKILDRIFAPETQAKGTASNIPSAGHCAIVALLLQSKFQGELVSAKVNNTSHWFNKINGIFVDLTGDQFGFPKIQLSDEQLYPETRVRNLSEVTSETFLRYSTFKDKYEGNLDTMQRA